MARHRTRLESRFPQAKKAGHQAVAKYVSEAVTDGAEEAQARLGRVRDTKGYDLDPFAVRRKLFDGGEDGGMVFVPSEKWFYRFFEYGTVFIGASAFMRPAHRKMRAKFLLLMGKDFDGFIKRRTRRL